MLNSDGNIWQTPHIRKCCLKTEMDPAFEINGAELLTITESGVGKNVISFFKLKFLISI